MISNEDAIKLLEDAEEFSDLTVVRMSISDIKNKGADFRLMVLCRLKSDLDKIRMATTAAGKKLHEAIRNEVYCCDPDHEVVPCCNCGIELHTCEKKEEDVHDGKYLCPMSEHNNGGELSDGRWVCSDCWDIVVNKFDEGDQNA